jgi:hypothetical protein
VFAEGSAGKAELMPTYFPQLTGGLTTQRPYKVSHEFNTLVTDMPSGPRLKYAFRGAGLNNFPVGALGKFEVGFPGITDAEIETLKTFFTAQEGKLNEFIFLDPGGNLIPNSENFSDSSWTLVGLSSTPGVTDPFGGSLATTLSSGGSNSMLYATVLPLGGASGYVLTASLWARAGYAGQNLSIGFIDSAFGVLGNRTWALPQGKWTRIYHTITLATASYIRVLIGGLATWNSSPIDLFGVMCSPMPGPGGYAKSPANYGYRPRCRFDTDEFTWRKLGPNYNSVTLPIREFF